MGPQEPDAEEHALGVSVYVTFEVVDRISERAATSGWGGDRLWGDTGQLPGEMGAVLGEAGCGSHRCALAVPCTAKARASQCMSIGPIRLQSKTKTNSSENQRSGRAGRGERSLTPPWKLSHGSVGAQPYSTCFVSAWHFPPRKGEEPIRVRHQNHSRMAAHTPWGGEGYKDRTEQGLLRL